MRDVMLLTADWERVASVSLPAGELPECVVYAGQVYVRRLGLMYDSEQGCMASGIKISARRAGELLQAYQEALCVWTEGSEG